MRDFYKNKTILITGASGYIAQNLIAFLLEFECKIICISRSNPFTDGVQFISTVDYLDYFNEDFLKETDIIFYLNSQTSVKEADLNPAQDTKDNIIPLLSLIEQIQKLQTSPTLVFPSSVSVFGLGDENELINESSELSPLSFYDQNKITAEQYLAYFSKNQILKGTVLRLANVYGPGVASSKSDRGIINQMVKNSLQGKPFKVYGHGKFWRDYIYIQDVVKAFATAPLHIDKLNGHCFNICTGESVLLSQAFELALSEADKISGLNQKLEFNKEAPIGRTEARHFKGSNKKFSQITGWKAEVSLKDGLSLTARFYKDQQ